MKWSKWPLCRRKIAVISWENIWLLWLYILASPLLRPPWWYLNMPSSLLPQGLCTLCSPCLGCSSPVSNTFFFLSLHSDDLSVPLSETPFLIILSCLQHFLSYYPPLFFFVALITLWNTWLYSSISLLPSPYPHPPLEQGLSLLFTTVTSGCKKYLASSWHSIHICWLNTLVWSKVENSPRKGKLSCIRWIAFFLEGTLGSVEENWTLGCPIHGALSLESS